MSEAEPAGDPVETMLLASAVETTAPAAIAPDGHTHETRCLNCAKPLTGPFCAECGQAAHVHRTLAAFFHDLLHGVFHFEARIWHTLPMLALQPGTLTRRYIDGQRARYISPLALFLFCAFLLYATIGQTAGSDHPAKQQVAATRSDQLQKVQARLAVLTVKRRDEIAHHADTDDTDTAIASLQIAMANLKPGEQPPGLHPTNGAGVATPLPKSLAFLDRIVASVKANPDLALYKVEIHAYKYSWLLIPISVPFLWLLFPFDRRFPIYDHTVFVTYSLCFMTLLTVILLIADALGLEAIKVVLVAIAPIHIYRQLRGAYHCSRLGAALRAVALTLAAGFALVIFAAVIVAASTD